jgi:hypothetical protein
LPNFSLQVVIDRAQSVCFSVAPNMWNLNRVNGLSFSSKMLIEMMSFTNKNS